MTPRRVLFLVDGGDGVSCRFRVLQYLPHLAARGIAAAVADLHAPPAERRHRLALAADHDAVVVHRAFLSPRELRRLARPYVFDFDDAIMFRDSAAPRQRSWQRRLRFARMARHAGHVVAGSRYLADLTVRYQPRVTVIATTVDPAEYGGDGEVGREPIIGWMGTRINLMYLRPIVAALVQISVRDAAARVKIVCDGFEPLPGVPVIEKRWSRADEADDLRSFRVGIMPLRDDLWTRGKCALKLLQYMAAGLPVVCSPVGANLDVVEHGRTGFFARTDEEWVRYLEELLCNDERRRAFGAAGRARVREHYAVTSAVDALVKVLSDVR